MAIDIDWDGSPVRQQFGSFNIVADGVATLSDGRRYRINASASRAAARPEVTLRYLTPAKRGDAVPESAMRDVRAAALRNFAELLAPMRAAYVAAARERDNAYLAELRKPAAEVASAFVPAPRQPVDVECHCGDAAECDPCKRLRGFVGGFATSGNLAPIGRAYRAGELYSFQVAAILAWMPAARLARFFNRWTGESA